MPPASCESSVTPVAKAHNRPLSCQFMIIDNETTDKLLRDFFESKAKKYPMQQQQQEQKKLLNAETKEPNTEKNDIEIEVPLKSSSSSKASSKDGCVTKKKKFSTFRIFMKNQNQKVKSVKKKQQQQQQRAPKSNGFVNCITSSSSNASSLKDISENKESIDQNGHKEIVLDKSFASLNSKLTNEIEYDEEDYTEIQNLEKCPIAASDLDIDYADDIASRTDSNLTPNNEFLSSTTTATAKTTPLKSKNVHIYDKNKNDLIAVPLNSYLYYNYEKKEDDSLTLNNNNNKVIILTLFSPRVSLISR